MTAKELSFFSGLIAAVGLYFPLVALGLPGGTFTVIFVFLAFFFYSYLKESSVTYFLLGIVVVYVLLFVISVGIAFASFLVPVV